MQAYLICPVRLCSDIEHSQIGRVVEWLEERQGYDVFWPLRDNDEGGTEEEIIQANLMAIRAASIVLVWWHPQSEGSRFDLGAAMVLHKPIHLLNAHAVAATKDKSFTNLVLQGPQLFIELPPELQFPLPRWSTEFAEFVAALKPRMVEGLDTYGDGSFERPAGELVGELAEELIDIVGWALPLYVRMKALAKVLPPSEGA